MTNPFASIPAAPAAPILRDPRLPADGLHVGTDFATYHAWNAASSSRLADMSRSPAYCRERIDVPTIPTPAMVDGSATHTAILEPDLIDKRYVVATDCAATTKAGATCGNGSRYVIEGRGYCGVKGHAPSGPLDERTVLSVETKAGIDGRLASLARHDRAAKLMSGLGVSEASFVWTDPETGAACKGRLDRLVEVGGKRILVDLKRTREAHPDDFPRFLMNGGAYRQLAWYADGLRAIGQPVDSVVIVAIMDDAPYEVYLYRPLDVVLDYGRAANRSALAEYVECVRSGSWPMGTGRVLSVDLPEWAKQKMAAQQFVEENNLG